MNLTNLAAFAAGSTLSALALDLLIDPSTCVGPLDYLSVVGALVTTVLGFILVYKLHKH